MTLSSRNRRMFKLVSYNFTKVKKNKVTPQDFNATIGSALGLPIEKEFFSPTGRPFHITGKGTPIKDILT